MPSVCNSPILTSNLMITTPDDRVSSNFRSIKEESSSLIQFQARAVGFQIRSQGFLRVGGLASGRRGRGSCCGLKVFPGAEGAD